MAETFTIKTNNKDLVLRVSKGHFATSHSHINYYVNVTKQKTSLNEAKAVAHELYQRYRLNYVIDTILCLDGTEVIGAFMADYLISDTYRNPHSPETIAVVTPEFAGGSQIIFRDNLTPMITSKQVLVLAASVTSGKSAASAIRTINYYGGKVVGIAAIFSIMDSCNDYEVNHIFSVADLGDYASYESQDCPLCKAGHPIEALVNAFGYSALVSRR